MKKLNLYRSQFIERKINFQWSLKGFYWELDFSAKELKIFK